jgi:hypothetical protein
LFAPVDELHYYFGSEVAFYFAWMNFFTTWLVVPGLIGLGVYCHRIHYGYSLENHPLLPLFSLFMVIWAILFTKYWKRMSAYWACKWNTSEEIEEEEMRPEHFGDLVQSPITGQSVLHYPEYKRIPSYVLSLIVTSLFLAIAFSVMICSLNLQGYIKGDSYNERFFKVEVCVYFLIPLYLNMYVLFVCVLDRIFIFDVSISSLKKCFLCVCVLLSVLTTT